MLTKSRMIYLLLLAWIFVGSIVDSFILAHPAWMSVADIVHMLALIILALAWCRADADANGHRRPNGWNMVALVFIVPLGLAIYLFRTRRIPAALVQLAAFLAGCVASSYAGILAGDEFVQVV